MNIDRLDRRRVAEHRRGLRRVAAMPAGTPRVAADANSHMTVINEGNNYDIYGDGVRTYNALPAQAYRVCFHPEKGFWLMNYPDFQRVEGKVYGAHPDKARKVINRYLETNNNLGVILSGDKGIGKSVTMKIIAGEMIAMGYPVIVVNQYIRGIASFLGSIDQRCCVLFDEYDKTFAYSCQEDFDPSTEMLTLFDGVDGGSKLFVITCNDFRCLNEYLINRPGRFHFHLRFNYPTADEIREYLEDNVAAEHADEVERVISLANRAKLNYDCLRAIATELNAGERFEEAINDLNILVDDDRRYRVTVRFSGLDDAETYVRISMVSDNRVNESLYSRGECYIGDLFFIPADAEDMGDGTFRLAPENITISFGGSDFVRRYATAEVLEAIIEDVDGNIRPTIRF